MLNRKIMLGVAALSLSTLAATSSFAIGPGAYVGGQLGYGNVHQSNISRSDMTSLLSNALSTNTVKLSSFSNSGHDSGLAGRLFAGYQFDTNWAAELGWSKFSTMSTKATATTHDFVVPVTAQAKGEVKTNAIDLVAKGAFPVVDKVSVYGKLGVAYVMANATASADVFMPAGGAESGKGSDKAHKLYPTFGVGATYDLTNNIAADLSYNRIQKTGSSNRIGSTDLVSAGLIYSFS
ncbi:MAG: outer membrane beta-barrel protein [Gammaproteobacteria bacterium]|nr:outer membrane beta-barrel protein [Gammaproteobacteria bacterium]MCW5583307.1 outer membrane beta-barrel protein [Gammaproteobacteria bacterium]